MIGFYNYTVILTYVSLINAMMGIFVALEGNINLAIAMLIISGICDMFDGKIARTKLDRTEDEAKFGIQIDSLCDIVCFNVFPSVIGYAIGVRSLAGYLVLSFYVLAGVIRLAYFNVTEEKRQEKSKLKRKVYTGLPVTMSSVFIPLIVSFRELIGERFPFVYIIVIAILGILQISERLKVTKPGKGDPEEARC